MKIWIWRYEDKQGRGGEITTRGPNTLAELHDTQTHLLGQMALNAMRSGAADPELRVVSECEAGASESAPGEWRPANAKPIDMNQFAARPAAGDDKSLDTFDLE